MFPLSVKTFWQIYIILCSIYNLSVSVRFSDSWFVNDEPYSGGDDSRGTTSIDVDSRESSIGSSSSGSSSSSSITENRDDASSNPHEFGHFFEGDMILSTAQKDDLLTNNDQNGFGIRNGLRKSRDHWPNLSVPYLIDRLRFFPGQIKEIERAIDYIHNVSCVRFHPRTKRDKDVVFITGLFPGCSSQVGYQGGRQLMNLQPSRVGTRCFHIGTILHEFLHVLGFYHMQSASNRDDYVKINWKAIADDKVSNFRKYSSNIVTSYGFPYDFDSVMHYPRYAFSKTGEDTIIPKVPNVKIGQRGGMSKIDVGKLNAMYGCS